MRGSVCSSFLSDSIGKHFKETFCSIKVKRNHDTAKPCYLFSSFPIMYVLLFQRGPIIYGIIVDIVP